MTRREFADIISGRGNVCKGTRIAAPLADPAVFDIPGGNPARAQRFAHVTHIRKAVLGAPVAAVNADGEWMRPLLLGHAQVSVVLFASAVCNASVRRGSGP